MSKCWCCLMDFGKSVSFSVCCPVHSWTRKLNFVRRSVAAVCMLAQNLQSVWSPMHFQFHSMNFPDF